MLGEMTPRKVVEFAVKTEELGQGFYKMLAKRYEDEPEIKEIFALLAEDEAIHAKQFRALADDVPQESFDADQNEQLEYLRAMSLSEFFLSDKELENKLASINDTYDALMRAFEMEKATLQYYTALKDVLGENTTLAAIIKAERSHLMKIMQYIMTDAKFRGIADNF